ncbi:MAG: hypothetical protein GY701_32900 [Sulfitobacter sp.]|nr:hypothetical protein [Sulfitobacter sp.]
MRAWVLVIASGVALLVGACGGDDDGGVSSVDPAVCEALGVERLISFVPRLAIAELTVGEFLSTALTGSIPGDPASVIVSLEVDRKDRLEEVAAEVRSIEGVEAVDPVDQEQAYVELAEIFAGQPDLVESVEPETLRPSVRARVVQDDAIEAIHTRFADDARIREVIDDRLSPTTVAVSFGGAVDVFGPQLEILSATGGVELGGAADELVRLGGLSPEGATVSDLRAGADAAATIEHYTTEVCGVASSDSPTAAD